MNKVRLLYSTSAFSYLEVLIAAAILTIASVPILSGFIRSSQYHAYAINSYTADLFAETLLLDTQEAISSVHGKDLFADLYDSYKDRFDYIITIEEITEDARVETHTSDPKLVSTGGASADQPINALPQDLPFSETLIINYDNGFDILDGSRGTVETDGEQCHITLGENEPVRINIVRLSTELSIVVENNNTTTGYVDVYKSTGIPDEMLVLSYIQDPAGIVVRYHESDEFPDSIYYIITVEVFDKRGRLLKKTADVSYTAQKSRFYLSG